MRKLSVFLLVVLLLALSATVAPAQEVTQEPPPATTEVSPPPATTEAPPQPTVEVTVQPTVEVTVQPTAEVTVQPTIEVTEEPTSEVTTEPTEELTAEVTATVTPPPVFRPTATATTASVTMKLDTTPRIAIESAFAPEITVLLQQTQIKTTFTVNGVDFTTGTLQGHDVVLFLSGVSIVNAAMTTQSAIDHFNLTRIIFSGIAGGVNPSYHIGDVVVAQQWAQYEEAYAAREDSSGAVATPQAAPFPPFTFFFPQTVNVRSNAHPEGEDLFWFPVDAQMFAVAQQVASTVQLAKCTSDNVCLTDAPVVHVGGSGVSGPTFVDNATYRDYVYATFGADALDMETASAEMVAYANSVPFLAFRSLSDLAGGGPGANEIGTFFQLAANNSATVTLAFLQAWQGQ